MNDVEQQFLKCLGGDEMNNFQIIKGMSVEVMAIFLANHVACEYCPMQKNCIAKNGCDELFKQWLEQESEEE